MNLLTATSAKASAFGAANAVRGSFAFGSQAGTGFARAAAHTSIRVNVMGTSSIADAGSVCKRSERDSWTNMSSCGSAEVTG